MTSADLIQALLNDDTDVHPLPGNAPMVLDDPATAFLVRSGLVDVFAVRVRDGQVIGRRRHLLRAESGDIVLALDFSIVDAGIRLIAAGTARTTVVPCPVAVLQEIARDTGAAGPVTGMVERWVKEMGPVLTTIPSPAGTTLLAAPSTCELTATVSAISRGGVIWVNSSGALALGGRDDLPDIDGGSLLPLPPITWIRALEQTQVEIIESGAALSDGEGWNGLALFQRMAARAISADVAQEEADEQQRLEQRGEADALVRNAAQFRLAAVLNRTVSHAVKSTADPLLEAGKLVGKAQGIDLRPAFRALESERDLTPQRLAYVANVRIRTVTLEQDWWKHDNGPLLGRLMDLDRAVALLPAGPGKYQLHDTVAGTVTSITPEVAEILDSEAFYLYRPFPRRSLRAWDLVKFGLTGCRRDVRNVLMLGIAGGLLGLALPVATQMVFDDVIPYGGRTQLLAIGLLLFSVFAAIALFQVARSIAVLRIEGKMDTSLQAAIWDRLLGLPVSFFRDYSAGDLGTRAMSLAALRQTISNSGLTTTILNSMFSFFSIAIMFYYEPGLALMGVGLILLVMVISSGLAVAFVRKQRVIQEISGKLSGLMLQIINGIAEFRVKGAEDRAYSLWADQFADQRTVEVRAQTTQGYLQVVNVVYPVLATLAVFIVFASQNPTALDTGRFLAFTTAFLQVIANLLQVTGSLTAVLVAVPLFERVRPILQSLPEADPTKPSPGQLHGEIEVSHASFRYDPSGPLILDDVTFTVRPGEMIALVGPSGSGKSTLLRLLLGFDQAETGAVYYDRQDLADLEVRDVRRQIGTVMQNGKVMQGNILQNIAGSALLTTEEAWIAARLAGLDKDIRMMPMGMQTMVNEEGSTFSGGQRQRLMIARAIARKPRIIFFDEATSSLDNATQAIVSHSLETLNASRVVIAHRLSTIVNADRIYVMQGGRIVQVGTYHELMGQPGLFATLARRQLA